LNSKIPLVILSVGIVFSVLLLWLAPAPFLCLALLWVACFAHLVFRNAWRLRPIWFYSGLLCLLFAIAEVASGISLARRDEHFNRPLSSDYTRTDDVLGYAPRRNCVRRVSKHMFGEVLCEATYTIDSSGLRAVPGGPPVDDSQCILFFGGSYTYGEGVEDSEALPAVVQALAGIKTRNIAIHGYGPHQMLAAIESGNVESAVTRKPRLAIYPALVSHLARAAGLSFWDKHGPRYVLDPRGKLRRKGHFDDERNPRREFLVELLDKSWFYQRFVKRRIWVRKDDVGLFLALVGASRDALAARYPGIRFEVILWDSEGTYGLEDAITRGLDEAGIPWHLVTKIIPDLADHDARYRLHRYDRHPSPAAYRRVAEYIVEQVVQKPVGGEAK
jgi:hypothetical protein